MIVRIHDVTLTVRRVELPDACPKCHAAICTVIENNMTDAGVEGTLEAPDGDLAEFAPSPTTSWRDGDLFTVTGYQCRDCLFQLAEGDVTEVDDGS
jgi:hypothetical protein